MSVRLHGSGLRLVAEKTSDEIARDREAIFPLDFVVYDLTGRRSEAALSLIGDVRDDGTRITRVEVSADVQRLATRDRTRLFTNAPAADALLAPSTYVRILSPLTASALPEPEVVDRLGCAMKHAVPSGSASGLPAPYTYLGQIVAHDMSHMRFDGDLGAPENYRTHALDLDSILDAAEATCVPSADANDICGLRVGLTRSGQAFADLPRVAAGADIGTPCIADSRNDFSLMTAQMAVALIKFHQTVCTRCDPDTPGGHRGITRRHVQSLVLDDYLPRILDPAVYADVRTHGRRILYPGTVTPFYQVPLEFAAACYRFGHSQIRPSYDLNAEILARPFFNLRRHTYLGGIFSTFPKLKDSWVVDWTHFTGQEADPIDSALAADLLDIDPAWLDEDEVRCNGTEHSLALLTLRRGQSLALPTGQMLAAHLQGIPQALGAGFAPLSGSEILDAGSGVGAQLTPADRAVLQERTPLWFYVLREAQARGKGGRHLGPLGSRIVMEAIHAAIESAPDNILTGPAFTVDPNLTSKRLDRFDLPDLFDTVAGLFPQ